MQRREADIESSGVYGGILADEMGLGKTVQMLSLISQDIIPKRTLIVVPVALVQHWEQQCQDLLNIEPCIVRAGDINDDSSTDLSREKIVIAPHSCFNARSINYSKLHCLLQASFHRVIVDEAHSIKNSSSKLFKGLQEVHAKHRWCLTGTPIVCKEKDGDSLLSFVIGNRTLENLVDIATIILRRTKEELDTLQPPPLDLRCKLIPFTSRERLAYGRQYICGRSELNDEIMERGMIFRVINSVRQLCITRSKMDALVECYREHPPDTRSLIFCHYHQEVEMVISSLRKNFPNLILMRFTGKTSLTERDACIRSMAANDDPYKRSKALVLQMQAGGVGLNIPQASRVYITSPDWNAAAEIQAIARAHRVNTQHTVVVTRMVMRDSVEEEMHAIQQEKLDLAADVLRDDRLRSVLNSSDGSNVMWEVRRLFQSEVFDDLLSEDDDNSHSDGDSERSELTKNTTDDDDLPVCDIKITAGTDVARVVEYLGRFVVTAVVDAYRINVVMDAEGGNAVRAFLGLERLSVWAEQSYTACFAKLVRDRTQCLGISVNYATRTDAKVVEMDFTVTV